MTSLTVGLCVMFSNVSIFTSEVVNVGRYESHKQKVFVFLSKF